MRTAPVASANGAGEGRRPSLMKKGLKRTDPPSGPADHVTRVADRP